MANLENKIIKLLKNESGIAAAIIFGSQAHDLARPDSDIDIAILYEHESLPKTLELIELREQLIDKLGKAVDLVCLNTCSPIIGLQAYKNGKVILNPDKKIYNQYLMRLFTDYHDLKYLRKPAEDAISKRRYYG